MWLWLAVCVFAGSVYGGGGVTKASGIEQFWTDDYKIFEQVYGKTSDKELYGANLPPNIEFGGKDTQASEKKERYLQNFQKETEDYDFYNFENKYNLLLTHDAVKPKKEKPSLNFISYNNFKPISQNSDPETYNYLKRLEEMEKDKISKYPIGIGGFKPYLDYKNPEETDAYKSIQDILDAHEANKGDDDDEDSKHLTYRAKGKKKKPARINEPKPARNKNSKPRCLPGRCRKRSHLSYRVRSSRPYVRRIKQHIIY